MAVALLVVVPGVLYALSTARMADRSYQWANPLPQGNAIQGMAFPSSTTGYAVGRSGTILKTTNGGGSWTSLDASDTTEWRAASFVSTSTGWIAGQAGRIRKTSDGGASWTAQPSGTTAILNGISFVDSTRGIAVGQAVAGQSTLKTTSDGGATWTSANTTSTTNLNAVSSISDGGSLLAWAVGSSGTMLRSGDGGINWTPGPVLTAASLNAVTLVPGTTIGYAAGNPSGTTWNVFKTTDGISWTPITTLPGAGRVVTGVAVNSTGSNVTLVGANGTILRSDDYGVTWTSQDPAKLAAVTMRAVCMPSVSQVVVGGDYGAILWSRDSGGHWFSEMQTSPNDILDAWFLNSNSGYAVGTGGLLMRTTDAGTNWSGKSLGAYTVRGVSVPAADNMWVVGDGGRMMRSQGTLGESFSAFNTTPATTTQLNDVYFQTSSSGWIVGNSGRIVRVTNGTAVTPTLVTQASGTVQNLYSVWFSDATKGWAVGRNGTILRTVNAGGTWSAQSSGTTKTINAVWSFDNSKAFAVGEAGLVLKTINAGATWQDISALVATTRDLYSVFGTDANNVWVGGAVGMLKRTTNGGSSWATQGAGFPTSVSDGGAADIRTLYFSATSGYVLGTRGEIRRSTNSGTDWSPHYYGTLADLRSVQATGSVAVVAGASGTMVNSFDGGASWYQQLPNTTTNLNSVSMSSASTGFVAGAVGHIARTTNGGWTWATQNSNTTNQLTGIDTPDGTHALAVGTGVIRHTTNSGGTWSVSSGFTAGTVFNAVSMPSSTTAWAVASAGTGATVWKFSASGSPQWTSQTTTSTLGFNGVDFVDNSTGWIVGPSGTIFKTTNGGASWTPQSSGTVKALYSVSARTNLEVRAVGADGVVLFTDNGGATWTTRDTGTVSSDMRGVAFFNDREGYVTGQAGTIIRAYDLTAPSTVLEVDPSAPDGLNDWYVTKPTIRLTPNSGSVAYYSWDSTTGPFTTYSAPIQPDQGVHRLFYRSVNASGVIESVNYRDFSTDTFAPSAPSNPATTALSATSVSLDWSAATDPAGGSGLYGYYVYLNGALATSTVGTSASIAGLTPNTNYSAIVVSTDNAGNMSPASNIVAFTTPDSAAAALGTSITIDPATPDGSSGWYKTSPNVTLESVPATIDAYIYYSWDATYSVTPSISTSWAKSTATNTVSVTATSGAGRTLYYFSAPAVSETPTRAILISSYTFYVDPVTPSTPTSISATATGQYSIRLAWEAPVDSTYSGINRFNIYTDAGDSVATVLASENSTTGTLYEYEITGLSPDTAYSYKIKAVSTAGNASVFSATRSATTLPPPQPDPPAVVYARGVDGDTAYLNWEPVRYAVGEVQYRIWRSRDGSATSSQIATVTGRYNFSYVDTGLRSSRQYLYWVVAADDRGTSERSGTATATTGPPYRVDGLSAIETSGGVVLSWVAPPAPADETSSGVVGYHVYRATSSMSSGSTLTVTPTAGTAYFDTSGVHDQPYFYRVAAVDASGAVGAQSVELRALRPAPLPQSAENPHGSDTLSDDCAACHRSHSGVAQRLTLHDASDTVEPSSNPIPDRGTDDNQATCFSCHDGSAGSNIAISTEAAFTRSNHVLTGATTTPLFCGNCHASHRTKNDPPTPDLRLDIDGATSGEAVCYGCHGAGSTLEGGDITRFDSSVHASVQASSQANITCAACHDTHGSPNEQLLTYSGWMVCMQCHGTRTSAETPDILSLMSINNNPDSRHDMTVEDQAATGARVTCQNCHNTHAVTSAYPLVDPDNPSLDASATWTGDRISFCLRCHDDALPTSTQTGTWVARPLAAGGATKTVDIASVYDTNAHGMGPSTIGGNETTVSEEYLKPEMGYLYGDNLSCSVCHDGHGTVNGKNLKQNISSANGSIRVDGALVVPVPGGGYDTRFMCAACHEWTPARHWVSSGNATDTAVFPMDCTACHSHTATDF